MIALSESGLAEAVSPEYCQVDESEFLRRQLRVGTFLNIEQEADYPGEMLLCELIALKNNRLMVNSYDITLLKLEEIEIPFESITKITFDDGYSRAARRALRKLSKQKIGSSSCRITSKKLLPGGGKKKRKGVNQ